MKLLIMQSSPFASYFLIAYQAVNCHNPDDHQISAHGNAFSAALSVTCDCLHSVLQRSVPQRTAGGHRQSETSEQDFRTRRTGRTISRGEDITHCRQGQTSWLRHSLVGKHLLRVTTLL
jgi:hypothetical protein